MLNKPFEIKDPLKLTEQETTGVNNDNTLSEGSLQPRFHSKETGSKINPIELIESTVDPPQFHIKESPWAILATFFLFSYIGVLVRIGLNDWLSFGGEPVSLAAFPQFVGCVIIGYLFDEKNRFDAKSHTLLIGLFTALCGSITTFSSVILYSSQQFFNVGNNNRPIIDSISGGLAVLLIGFGMAYAGFMLGRYLYQWTFDKYIKEKFVGKLVIKQVGWFDFGALTRGDIIIILLALACIAAIIPIAILVDTNRNIIFSILFAPAGSLVRRQLGLLNPKHPNFPIGTFLVNVVGSTIIVVLYLLPAMTHINQTQCNIISGLIDGFCGCLTTVSTFVVELNNLKNGNRRLYGLGSIIVAAVLQIILFATIYSPRPYVDLCT